MLVSKYLRAALYFVLLHFIFSTIFNFSVRNFVSGVDSSGIVPVVIGGDNLPSPVGIGLTDLPNIGGEVGEWSPCPPGFGITVIDLPKPGWAISHPAYPFPTSL